MDICDHASPPTKEHECLSVVWSNGKSCAACEVDCYRKGWKKPTVDADNMKLVREASIGKRS